MFCPECGTLIKKGYFTCDNCRFKIKLTREINREKDKKEIDDAKAKKIIEEKPKLVEKKKEVEEKTAVKDNKIPKPKKVKKDSEIKSENIEKSIIPGALDKKEIDDAKAKKIIEEKPKLVEKKKEVEEKTAVKDNKIPKPKKVKKDSEIKSENIEKSIIPGALDKKENNDTQAKKIEESEASPVQENRKMKRNLKKKIGLLYERLIDNSFQEKT
jgi:hypothetical protein